MTQPLITFYAVNPYSCINISTAAYRKVVIVIIFPSPKQKRPTNAVRRFDVLRPTYKPPSVVDDHLSAPPVTGWSQAAHPALFAGRAAPMRLLGLAPGGVCPAAGITARAGGLLHHRFTLAHCWAIYLSVALAVGLPRLAVSQHRALWRADFPPPAGAGSDHPVSLNTPPL